MAREINPVCDFFFSFMHTNLPIDTIDVELTLRTVQGIYIYCKDHTVETTIFTPWSKSVTPFPSFRRKIKAFKEESKGQTTLTWTPSDSNQISPPKLLESMPQARLGHDGPIVTIVLTQLKLIELICWGQT